MVRVSAHRNGESSSKAIAFTETLESLYAAASAAFDMKVTRAFFESGADLTDTSLVTQDEHIYFSNGADFIKPRSLTPIESKIVNSIQIPTRNSLVCYLNGKRLTVENPDPEVSLTDFLRQNGCTSVKRPCGEGGCGGCAVAIARFDRHSQRVHHFAVNSCLVPLPFVDGCAITTAEGVGLTSNLHPIQRDLAVNHGTQCGFCSPGIVTTLYALFAENPERTVEEIEEALSTNLCRCTGYRPIFDTARRYAIDFDHSVLGEIMNIEDADTSAISTKDRPLVTAEFPEELKNIPETPVLYSGENSTWFKPTSLDQMKTIKDIERKQTYIVSGATDLNFKKVYHPDIVFPLMIATADVKELKQIKETEKGVTFGAAVSVNQLTEYWHSKKSLLANAFIKITKQFANYNIRNIGTIGGSLIAGDALSDLCPVLFTVGAVCTLVSVEGTRQISAVDLVTKKSLAENELLVDIYVPFQSDNEFVRSYKFAKRREDSQSLCSGCVYVKFDNNVISAFRMTIGAVAAKQYYIEDTVVGREWNYETYQILKNEIFQSLEVSKRVGHAQLRKDLVDAMVYRHYLWIAQLRGVKIPEPIESAVDTFVRHQKVSHQTYDKRQEKTVGTSQPHVSAYGHTTGEATFVGDIPVPVGTLYAAPVQSKCAEGKIESIDSTDAEKVAGFVDFLTVKDIPGKTKISSIPPADEDVFADGEVHFYGQVIGLIVATSEVAARKAARRVKVTYCDVKTPIITVSQAMEAAKNDESRYLVKDMHLAKGSKTRSDIEVRGKSMINNQEHFYLETNSMLVVPLGDQGMRVYAACQNPAKIQESVAFVLDKPRNTIQCEVMRLGGGFGGKQDRPQFYACQAAIASHKLNKPIRYVLNREEDLTTAGMRHEYLSEYKIGADKDGNLTNMEFVYHSNGGWTMDLSQLVMDRTVYSATGGYACPNVDTLGQIYRTNKLSCTAFRGFGVPQSLLTVETAMAHLGHVLGVRPEVLKEKNLYHPNDRTLTGYALPDDNTRRVWFACKKSCDWDARVKEVEEFNKTHVYKKRGISIVPVVSTMGFESEFMMKGHALVQIYGDGTVSVSHGGLEMGQGVHTKMQMIAAETLGIPVNLVKVMPTATDKTVNMPPTAGSTGTDLHGHAVYNACKELNDSLAEIKKEHPDFTWNQICSYAFFNKYKMQASGWNRMPDSVYNHHTGIGRESYYLIWSAGFSMVELDVLTGEHVVLRSDIVHDCGSSINPALDIGQLEGGFVQGQGLFTTEDMIWDLRDGHIRSRNVTTYKIPTLDDMPDDFRVELLRDNYNEMGIYGAKASGEAGVRLACSVLMAIRDAITAARKEFGVTEWFELHSPATIEQIRSLIPVEFREV